MTELKIAVLLTYPESEATYQGYLTDFDQFELLLKNARPDWRCTPFKTFEGRFPDKPELFEGYIIGGSTNSVNDNEAWIADLLDYIRNLVAAGIPTIGVCFGHQAVAKALGGEVGPSPRGWGLGSVDVSFASRAPWTEPFRKDLKLYAIHKEQVLTPPQGARIMASAANCPVAAMALGERIFTTQHHPEFPHEYMPMVIDELAPDLDPGVIAEARESLIDKADNARFGEWMAKFLEAAQDHNRR